MQYSGDEIHGALLHKSPGNSPDFTKDTPGMSKMP